MLEPAAKKTDHALSLLTTDASPEAVQQVLTPDVIRKRLVFCPEITTDSIDGQGPYSPGFFLITGHRQSPPRGFASNAWQEGRTTQGVQLGEQFLQALGNAVLFPHGLFVCEVISELDTPELYGAVLQALGASVEEVEAANVHDNLPDILQEEFKFPKHFRQKSGDEE